VPSASPLYVRGELQLPNAPLSSRQLNDEPASDAAKAKVAWRVPTSPDGPLLSTVSGGVVSTVHVRDAGVGSVLPLLIARTRIVCCPSSRFR
jgi:hypothetical protein